MRCRNQSNGGLDLQISCKGGQTPERRKYLKQYVIGVCPRVHLERLKLMPAAHAVPSDISSEGKIYRLFALNEDASECEDLNIKAGKAFRLRGINLNFDIKDANQGVFVENEDGITRLNSYNRRGSNNVDAVIPPSLSAGSYSVNKALIRGSIYKSREGYLSRFCSYSGKTLYIRRELAKLLRSTCSFKI